MVFKSFCSNIGKYKAYLNYTKRRLFKVFKLRQYKFFTNLCTPRIFIHRITLSNQDFKLNHKVFKPANSRTSFGTLEK